MRGEYSMCEYNVGPNGDMCSPSHANITASSLVVGVLPKTIVYVKITINHPST